jgi:hypothetical protein
MWDNPGATLTIHRPDLLKTGQKEKEELDDLTTELELADEDDVVP